MMLLKFKQHITQYGFLDEDSKILATVSGGLDSVVLSHLLKQSGCRFSIAHANFGLRGAESDGDEDFVRKLADDWEVQCFVKRFVKDSTSGKSTQMWAREVRYEWFDQLRDTHAFTRIVTAHHRDDNVETVLLNLIRGTGHKGLSGIHPDDGVLVRPLLPFSRKEIEQYAKKHNLQWKEDSSNQESDYKRNFVRHKVIPVLEALNPSLGDTMAQSILRFQEEQKVLDTVFDDLSERSELHIAEVLKQPSALLYIWHWVQPYGFTFSDAQDLHRNLENGSGAVFESQHFRVVRDRQKLFREARSTSEEPHVIVAKPGEYKLGDARLIFSIVEKEEVHFNQPEQVTFVDADTLTFPLTVRTWQQGDRFQPLGMKGQKKVSDLLIDEKVPLHLKSKQLLVISDDKIVWVAGLRLAEPFRLHNHTQNVLKIELHHA